MRQKDKQAPQSAEQTVRDIRRATRRHFSAEEKIRIVPDELRGEESIASAVMGTDLVSSNIDDVHASANATGTSANVELQSAISLSQDGAALKMEVKGFLEMVRAS